MKKNKTVYLLVTFPMAGFLLALACYLWQFDYKIRPKAEFQPAVIIRASLALKPASPENAAVCAVFMLKNEDRVKVRLADTVALGPLYQVQLECRDKGEVWQPVPAAPRSMNVSQKSITGKHFDLTHDAIVELVPGSALAKCINLSALFDLQAADKYRLTVSYQPLCFGTEFDTLNVTQQPASCVAEFELPKKQ